MTIKVYYVGRADFDTYDDIIECVHGKSNVILYFSDGSHQEIPANIVQCTVAAKGYSAV